jgi:hypothetical protein
MDRVVKIMGVGLWILRAEDQWLTPLARYAV